MRDIGPQSPAQVNLLLSRGLDHIESAASVMSVVGSPTAASCPLRPMSTPKTSKQPSQADVNTLFGEGIISISDRMGSME